MAESSPFHSLLQKTLGKECTVILHTGDNITGTLCTIDAHFNIVLSSAQKLCKGIVTETYPSIFIRGNQVLHLSSQE